MITQEDLKTIRERGYSDDEIWSKLTETNSDFSTVKERGYSLEEVASITSGKPMPEPEPVGTSIGEEISQIPAALKQSFGQPLESMGETAQVAGFPAVATALKGAIQEPEGYVSAGQRFMAPKEGEFQVAGFAPQYAPRAIAEQTGQILGSIGTRLAGAVAGGGLGALISPATGVAGAAAGSFAGPALFEAAQIVGPVALERAKNNGYAEPTNKDMAYAIVTAAGSGLLNAFGARYLPGGKEAVGSFSKKLASSFLGEGLPEGLDSLLQQVGETIETKKGIQVNPKQAIGEALIGGAAGAAATTIAAPFTPEQIAEAKITESANKEVENLFIGNDNPQGKAVLANKQKLEQEIADTKQVLQAIESTDPVAQKLKLELKEKEAILAAAQGQVDSIVESADPVAEAEKQQIELAKAITTPEAAAPTEQVAQPIEKAVAQPIETPTPVEEAAPVAAPVEQVVTPPVEVAPTIAEAAPVEPITPAVEEAPTAESLVPPVALENIKKNPDLYEAVRKDAVSGSRVVPYISNSVSSRNLPKGFSQSLTAKVKKQVGDNPSISEIEDAIETEVEKTAYNKEKKKADDFILKSAQSRKGESYDLDVAIQGYADAIQNVDKVTKEAMGLTPDIRRLQRVSARNEAEIAKNKLIAALEKPTTPAPVTKQAAPAEAPAPEVAPTPQVEQEIEVGDEVSVNLAGRNETVTIARIEDINGVPTAYFDYFGYKSQPLAGMQLVKKSKQNIARAERKAKEAKESQIEITPPKPEDFFSNEEIASLVSGKAPDGWKSNTSARDDFFLTDTNGKRWSFTPQYENGEITSILMRAEGQVTGVTITKAPTPAVSETITEPKSDVRYNPLGYDIADVVEDIKQGKTDTPLKAVNQVIKESTDLRKRVAAESTRRQQPRKMGKAAILERIARERSAGNINENTAKALTDFINRVNDDAIWDTAISIRAKGVSNYDFADNLVTFFLNQDKGDFGASVGIHEFWHGLSRFLPDAEVEKINNDYTKELADYLKKNPWFLAFVGRYSLTPEQFEAYKFFNPKEAETKLTLIKDEQGNIVKYKIKFDKDNYRYIMLDEFIAEKMTDLVLGKQQEPNTFLGKLAKVLREFMALIKARLGIDPYEKFYQAVTSTDGKLVLQRETGVAPAMQIYDPVEYDYSTRRMMAAEPEQGNAPIKPEAKTVTEGLVQGIDIGKETNMPINNKIESHIKNFAFVRGIFESASDRLRRAKFTKLATAIDDYYDQAQRRLGFANKILLPAFEEYSKQSKATKAKIDEEVKMFFAAQENKRDTDEFFDELNPITQNIVTAWQKFGEESGKENQRIGIKVYDKGLQRWRPIGRIEKFWPRVLKPEYKRALMEPDKYQKEYNEIVEALIKSGRIQTPEEAEVFISEYQGKGGQNDYFSGIEVARGQAFPEELYDYSTQVMTDYVARWAQHSSRIEQFGQKLGENSKTLWDRSRESTRDRRTIDYITAAQERVEGYYPNDPIVKGMATLNIWASGLQLGNPASAMLNFFGGTTLNAMVGQPGALSSYVSSFTELRKLGKELKDAREKGIVSRDLMNIVGDHQVVLESNGLAKAGQKTADFLLKWSGFTPVEQMVRTQSMIIGKSFLRKTLSSLSKNPNSSFSKRSLTWLNRNNIDADKLIVEQGSGPETDKLLRYFANISQGSYTIAQSPIFTDTPIGRFLFKYQKFSTQVMRQSWKNTFEPAWKAVTNKNETLQLPEPTRQLLYRLRLAEAKELGDNRKITLDEIPKKVTKAEGKALTIIPVMMWLGSAYVGGEVILRMRDMLFGVLMKGPSYEDIIKAFEDDEDDDELYLSLERAWYNLIGMGALGLIGNYTQFFMDWQDRERVKNPLDPPALSIFKETATFIQNAVDQGKITAGDINNYLNRTLSAYRVSQRLYQTAASGLGYSKAPTVAEEMFRRETASLNKYARRWAASAGLEYRTKRPMDIAPGKMTPINREISSYLQRGEPGAAVAYAKEYLNSLPKSERANAIQSMESGARNRQPLRLGNGPMDQAEKIAFKKWLKEKVSKEDFDKFQKLDSGYQKTYNLFLIGLPNK